MFSIVLVVKHLAHNNSFLKCNFPMNAHVRLIIGWSVGCWVFLPVTHSFLEGIEVTAPSLLCYLLVLSSCFEENQIAQQKFHFNAWLCCFLLSCQTPGRFTLTHTFQLFFYWLFFIRNPNYTTNYSTSIHD